MSINNISFNYYFGERSIEEIIQSLIKTKLEQQTLLINKENEQCLNKNSSQLPY